MWLLIEVPLQALRKRALSEVGRAGLLDSAQQIAGECRDMGSVGQRVDGSSCPVLPRRLALRPSAAIEQTQARKAYSWRRAPAGSNLAARNAGIALAMIATTRISAPLAAHSIADTNSAMTAAEDRSLCTTAVSSPPSSTPARLTRITRAIMNQVTRFDSAPKLFLRPISRVRRDA